MTSAQESPVLVGGTGRSGTTITGRLLGSHPRMVATKPRELRFISEEFGVVDALITAMGWPLAGGDRTTPEMTAAKVCGSWFSRTKPSGVKEGLCRSMTREEVLAATTAYEQSFPSDPISASRDLILRITSATSGHRADSRWVDTTPSNLRVAHHVHHLLPKAKFVHMIRDGRDVATSFAYKNFGPDDPFAALDMWGKRMVEASQAEAALPTGAAMRFELIDWQVDQRAGLTRLLSFVGEDLDPKVLRWYELNVSDEAMRSGRWQRDLTKRQGRKLTARYEHWLATLRERFPGQRLPGDPPE
jgi:hypothetical protein